MTIPVNITHTLLNYDKCITVEEMSVDINGQAVSRNFPGYKTVVKPGGTIQKYVWPGQSLLITEGPNLADIPADPEPNP